MQPQLDKLVPYHFTSSLYITKLLTMMLNDFFSLEYYKIEVTQLRPRKLLITSFSASRSSSETAALEIRIGVHLRLSGSSSLDREQVFSFSMWPNINFSLLMITNL